MSNNFRLAALDHLQFQPLFSLNDIELAAKGMRRMVVDEFPGFPCRISLADTAIGEEVILLNYEHHNVHSPYRADGPIFIRKIAQTAMPAINEIPLMFNHRLLSIRGFDKEATMIFAEVTSGEGLNEKLDKILDDKSIAYLHVHNARPGCFNCKVERV